jgi:hypothetical protein
MEVIKISSRFNPGTYINEAKSKLGSSGKVELSALENGISTAIRVAYSLTNLGYATVSKFETSLLENDGDSNSVKGLAKVMIRLDKAATFEKASKDFESSRAKNN